MTHPEQQSSTVTFDESAAETVIEAVGWQVDEFGFIVHPETMRPVRATNGQPLELHNLAGIVSDETGQPTPLPDDFNEIVAHVKRREDRA